MMLFVSSSFLELLIKNASYDELYNSKFNFLPYI